MAKEIERKFLVRGNTWRGQDGGKRYRQGYLSTVKERTVRVRTTGDKGFITIKGMSVGATRSEYEYEIPLADANEMLDRLCERPLIEKTRYRVSHEGLVWEIDEFEGDKPGTDHGGSRTQGRDSIGYASGLDRSRSDWRSPILQCKSGCEPILPVVMNQLCGVGDVTAQAFVLTLRSKQRFPTFQVGKQKAVSKRPGVAHWR